MSLITESCKAVKANRFEDLFSEDDKKWLDIIEQGRNEFTDFACESLLAALKKKVKPMDAIKYDFGREQGMILTRAAFAIMVKFSQHGETF